MAENLSDFSAKAIDGSERPLSEYKGKVVLVVNTASRCGFTPQYGGLQKLWADYRDRGLVVLGFPCNQFADQEPGKDADIASFCSINYGVNFPLFSKVEVNGPGSHPLFTWLKESLPGFLGKRDVKWNFTKFLVDRRGRPVRRFSPTTEPAKLARAIEKALSS